MTSEKDTTSARPARHLQYRADIDGLRAVAVLPVVAFHVGISIVPGGFVGVDVFFVISGYLISSIILSEFQQGRFSVLAFYERRTRRIFPALIATLAVTSVLAYVYLLPAELVSFAGSLLAATFSASNFYFWMHSGYFDPAASQQPLVHTWSLAVEEQFYILFPLFLMIVRRFFPEHLRSSIVIVAGLSFAASAVGAFWDPATTFYLPHTRAWELLLGTILAMGVLPDLRTAVASNIASLLGLGMIGAAIFMFSERTPFPGLSALLPCVGAGLVIHAGGRAKPLINRLLSLPPLVFIGLISYSLYLWHWPLILFQWNYSLFFSGLSSAREKALLVVLSLVFATLSWWLIERPFRRGWLRLPARSLFAAAAFAVAAIFIVAIGAIALRGFPHRFSPREIEAASYIAYDPAGDYREGTCFTNDVAGEVNFRPDICLRHAGDKKNYLVLGDSYAADLPYGLSRVFPGANFLQATGAGCKPTLEETRATDPALRRCANLMKFIFLDYLKTNRNDAVLLAASWRDSDLAALAETLDWANRNKIKIVLFGPKVQYDAPLPRILVAAIRQRDPTLPDRHRPDTFEILDRKMSQLADSKHVPYISFFQRLCTHGACPSVDHEGHPLTFDIGHLTRWGSLVTAQSLRGMQWP